VRSSTPPRSQSTGGGDIIARYREVTGSLVDPCFTKRPDPKDHPVFQVGQMH
jgi:hypothetical protein